MPTSQQINDLTTSSNGDNIQAKLQPKSHFFIEDNSFTQGQNDAFGPLSSDLFRTSSKVSFSGSKKIYAICKGTVFLQPQIDNVSNVVSTSKVNLILKPFTQPIKGIAIKYFIYRGLDKSNFINNGKIAVPSKSDFTELLWNQFNSYYEEEDPKPVFLEQFIGMPISTGASPQVGTDLIEKYFNKITSIVDEESAEENVNEAYELPIVPRGTNFGDNTGDISLDVVLDYGEYYIPNDPNPFLLDLQFARLAEGEIKIPPTSNPTAQQLFQAKLLREACTQFIDLAAFYGMHANGAGKLFVNVDPTPKSTASEIATMISNFYTKNNIYINIQANRQRSYDFYGNYAYSDTNTSNIKIGGTDITMAETTFGTMGWPIHIFLEAQDPGTSLNTLSLQLTTDGFSGAALYVKNGSLTSSNEINFVRDENLIPPERNDLNYIFPVSFIYPSNGASSIAGIIDIIYDGKQMVVEEHFDNPPSEPVYYNIKEIDDIFGLIDANSFKITQEEGAFPMIVEEKIQILSFPTEGNKNDIGTIKYKKVEDKLQTIDEVSFIERVTYETLVNQIRQDASAFVKSSSPKVDNEMVKLNSYGTSENLYYRPSIPYHIKKGKFTESSNLITNLNLISFDGNLPSKKILCITKIENNGMISTISTYSLSNTRFYLRDFHLDEDDAFYSTENISYKKYLLQLIGEDDSGNLQLFSPVNEIIIYSTDNFIFYSKNYSEFLPQNLQINFSEIDLTIE